MWFLKPGSVESYISHYPHHVQSRTVVAGDTCVTSVDFVVKGRYMHIHMSIV